MTEDELVLLLQDSEPPLPTIDQQAIVRSLRPQGTIAVNASNRWSRSTRMLAITSTACAASLLFWFSAPHFSSPPRSEQSTQLQAKLQASRQRSAQLHQELRQLMASSMAADQELVDDVLSLQSELRASESLWLMMTSSDPQESSKISQTILSLYPKTPAAERCLKLADN